MIFKNCPDYCMNNVEEIKNDQWDERIVHAIGYFDFWSLKYLNVVIKFAKKIKILCYLKNLKSTVSAT